MKILIIEDDVDICNSLTKLLVDNGYDCSFLTDFSNIVDYVKNNSFDLLLIDINLPGVNGDSLISSIRKFSNAGIIMVTSNTSEYKEMISMASGADDYITKPYNPTILLLRIQAVLNRINSSNDICNYRDLIVNSTNGVIKCNDNEVVLSKNEMIVFNYLFINKNRIVTRDELMTVLWNNEEYINDNALTVNISRIRSKLESIGSICSIETRKGLGYILV